MIKFLDLKKEYQEIKDEIGEAIKKVLDKGIFINGQKVYDLENQIAGYYELEYGIGVNSGTDALFLSLKAIEKGSEVIVPAFTFISTAEVVANLGYKSVFVDVDPDTFNIDVSKVKEKITDKTKAIIPVHLFGQTADMKRIKEIVEEHNSKKDNHIYIIEDSAQSISVENKKHITGDLVCFSFFPTKNLGAYGDGGMILTDNQELADKIRLIQNHGSSKKEKYNHLSLGINSRLDEIQAAILGVKLNKLSKWNYKRKEIAKYYNEKLKGVGDIKFPQVSDQHVFNQYTIRTEKRDQFKKYLEEQGIETRIYYLLPLHLQPAFKYLGYKEGDFPEAEKAAQEVLSLPIYPELSEQEQKYIIEKIKKFYG